MVQMEFVFYRQINSNNNNSSKLYVADTGNNNIREISWSDTVLLQQLSSPSSPPTFFDTATVQSTLMMYTIITIIGNEESSIQLINIILKV
jgi:hypothetical protein